MTTRERFEKKLQALQARYENLVSEMLDTIENLEGERDDAIAERDELAEQLNTMDAALA